MCVPVNSFIAATKFLPPKKYRICSVCQSQNDNPSYIFEGWEISRALYKISPKIYVVWYNSKFTSSNSHHVTWKWSILRVTIPEIVRSQWQRHVHPRIFHSPYTHPTPASSNTTTKSKHTPAEKESNKLKTYTPPWKKNDYCKDHIQEGNDRKWGKMTTHLSHTRDAQKKESYADS